MDINDMMPDMGPTRPVPGGSDEPSTPLERMHELIDSNEDKTANASEPAAPPKETVPGSQGEAGQTPDEQGETEPGPGNKETASEPGAPEIKQPLLEEPEVNLLSVQPEAEEKNEQSEASAPDAQAAETEISEPLPVKGGESEGLTAAAAVEPEPAEQAPAENLASEPETANPQETSPDEERHPTGEPEQTGGWYADMDQPAENPEQPVSTQESEAATMAFVPNPSLQPADEEVTQPQAPLQAETPRSEEDTAPVHVSNANLPRQVDQVDVNATRVTPAAYGGQRPASGSAGSKRQYYQQFKPTPQPSVQSKPVRPIPQKGHPASYPMKSKPRKKGLGCFWKGVIGILFIGVLAVIAAISFLVYQYYTIASSLPSVDDLKARASQFETTRLVDRNGNTLYEILDPTAGRRTYVTLDKISPFLIAATLATEDKEYYNHPGFDPIALLRALWQNYTAGGIASGASTITQQLARKLLLSPTEASQQTVQRKAREIILAAELTRKYSKDEVLELYLNENNYGNLSYGIEAAAETYFNTTADKLSLGQSAFLAGIPQAPSVYDILTSRTQTLDRFETVIMLMYTLSQESNCIYVSTSVQRVCVDAVAASQAIDEIENKTTFQPAPDTIKSPHWVTYIRSLLEAQFDPETIYRSGFTVYTTLDPVLQDKAETMVRDQVKALADHKVSDGALVAIRPATGEILAMVGSADFYNNQIAGQVNMAISPRQPGSSIKPLTYAAAFEKGWTPSTLIWDVPSEFPPSGDPNDTRPPYKPVNYDGTFHGPVTVRTALANSYNVPAVKTLQFVGIYDNPNTPGQDGLISFAKKVGITTLTRNDYGLSLTLGGGEVTVLDMTSAFSTFANSGQRMAPYAISKIVDHNGNVVYEYKPPAVEQTIRPEIAFLITSILSDNAARTPAFGANSVLNLPFPAAVKTGTTNDFRDNWTIGYTPDLAVGVWVGNADYTPMVNTTGVTGAAPIWSSFMKEAEPLVSNNKPSQFTRPSGIVERVICSVSGTEPSQWCPSQRGEFFAADTLPAPKENDLWQQVNVDTWTGFKASTACSDYTEQKFALNVTDPWAVKWITSTDAGKKWAKNAGFSDPIFFTPPRECKQSDSRPSITFSSFRDGDTVSSAPLDIYAVVDATTGFKEFTLEYGIGDNPVEWKQLGDVFKGPVKQPSLIYSWDMSNVPPGKFSLRIRLSSDHDTYATKKITLVSQVPTATPTPTPTLTPTTTPTITPSITPTVTQTTVPPTSTVTPTLPPPPPPL